MAGCVCWGRRSSLHLLWLYLLRGRTSSEEVEEPARTTSAPKPAAGLDPLGEGLELGRSEGGMPGGRPVGRLGRCASGFVVTDTRSPSFGLPGVVPGVEGVECVERAAGELKGRTGSAGAGAGAGAAAAGAAAEAVARAAAGAVAWVARAWWASSWEIQRSYEARDSARRCTLRRSWPSLRCRHNSLAASFLLTSRTSLRSSGTGWARAAAGRYLHTCACKASELVS